MEAHRTNQQCVIRCCRRSHNEPMVQENLASLRTLPRARARCLCLAGVAT